MRKLFFLLAFIPSLAFAQAGPEIYRIATPAQVSNYVTAGSHSAITPAIFHRVLDVTCTTDCYIWINGPGQSEKATAATGVFLPADVPKRYIVSPGSGVQVIGDTAGKIHIQELTR